MATGEELRKGTRSVKEIVQFDQEELAEETIEKKTRHTLRIIDKIEKLYAVAVKQAERLERMPKSKKRTYLRARYELARTRIEMSLLVRSIEFNAAEKKRMIDRMRHTVERLHTLGAVQTTDVPPCSRRCTLSFPPIILARKFIICNPIPP